MSMGVAYGLLEKGVAWWWKGALLGRNDGEALSVRSMGDEETEGEAGKCCCWWGRWKCVSK